MWTIALSCAALGILLSTRCKAFALAPTGLLVLALTVVYGLTNGWGVLGVVVATMANLGVLQASYVVAGLALQRLSRSRPVEGHVLRLRHTLP
jgi:hypothetical protein